MIRDQRLRALLFLPLCVDAVHLRGAPTPARTLVFNASVIHTMGGAANDETAEAFCVADAFAMLITLVPSPSGFMPVSVSGFAAGALMSNSAGDDACTFVRPFRLLRIAS